MPTLNPAAAPRPGAQIGVDEKFLEDLSNGLHALAQPLTILRSVSAILAMPQAAGARRDHYLRMAALEIERTCRVFGNVQGLMAARLTEPARWTFDLREPLTAAIDSGRFPVSANALPAEMRHAAVKVIGDAERTEQAISAVLTALSSLSSPGDQIEVLFSRDDSFAGLTFRNARSHATCMNSSARLSLSLAELNTLTQQGTYELNEDPFSVSLALPVDPGAQQDSDAAENPTGQRLQTAFAVAASPV